MSKRRGLVIVASALVVTLIAGAVVVGQLRAQGPTAPPPGATSGGTPGAPGGMRPGGMMGGPSGGMPGMMGPGGMPGMMGGRRGGGGGANLNWSEGQAPKELTMSYDIFLVKSGQRSVAIPEAYLEGSGGKPAKRTLNEWWQLQRIYAKEERKALKGRPGGRLENAMARELAAKQNEVAMVKRVYKQYAMHLFTFEMGAPHPKDVNLASLDQGGFVSLVSVRVNEGQLRKLLSAIERNFSEYSHQGYYPGVGRRAYRLVTWEHGVWNPKYYWLSNEALDEWNRLWSQDQLRVRAYGTDGSVIAEAKLSLGHTGTTPSDLLSPPDFPQAVRSEKWVLGLPYAKKGFDGGPGIHWDNLRGWLYSWNVSGPLAMVSQVDVGEVAFIGADGKVGATKRFGHPVDPSVTLAEASPDTTPLASSLSQVTSAQAFVQALWGGGAAAAGGRGSAGGPGGPGGMMMGGMGGPGRMGSGMMGPGGPGMMGGSAGGPGPRPMGPAAMGPGAMMRPGGR